MENNNIDFWKYFWIIKIGNYIKDSIPIHLLHTELQTSCFRPQFHRVSLKFFIEHFYTMSFMIAILVLLEMIKKLQDKTFLVIEFSNNKNKFYRLTNTINLINFCKSLITINSCSCNLEANPIAYCVLNIVLKIAVLHFYEWIHGKLLKLLIRYLIAITYMLFACRYI